MAYKSKTALLEEELEKQGRVRYYNTPEDIKRREVMNKQLLEIQRQSKINQKKSEISASQVLLIY